MNRKNYPLFENYDFSDCHEITGDELYLINGGARVENSNEAVANAKEGDTLVRNDGTEVTLTQGDINWAQKQVGSSSSSGTDTSTSQTTTTSASESSSQTESSNPTGSSSSNHSSSSSSSSGSSSSTSSGSSSSSSGNSSSTTSSTNNNTPSKTETKVPNFEDPFAPESNGNFGIDNKNKIVSADINRPQSVIDAYGAYYVLSDKDYVFQLNDGENVVHTFTDEEKVRNYVRQLDASTETQTLSEPLSKISTISGIANSIFQKIIGCSDEATDLSKLAKSSSIASKISTVTGAVALFLDLTKASKDPTFRNTSKVTSDTVGFIPFYGPFASVVSSYSSEQIQKAAEIGIRMEAGSIQKENQMNSFINTTNVCSLPLKNLNLDTMFKSACNQGLASFFEVN